MKFRLMLGAAAIAVASPAAAASSSNSPPNLTPAEAELEADRYAAAEAAADRALAADPALIEAMIYKGRAIMQRAVQGERAPPSQPPGTGSWKRTSSIQKIPSR